MRPLSFPVAAKRLLDFARTLPDTEENLKEFYDWSINAVVRTDSMYGGFHEGKKPGHMEWCEFRSKVHVRWSMYYDPIWIDGRDPKLHYPHGDRSLFRPDMTMLINLLREVVGEIPRKGQERTMATIEENCRRCLKEAKTKAQVRENIGDVVKIEGGREILNRILAEYPE